MTALGILDLLDIQPEIGPPVLIQVIACCFEKITGISVKIISKRITVPFEPVITNACINIFSCFF